MLSLFPDLLDWGFYVPFFFRIFLGTYMLILGRTIIKERGQQKNEDDQLAILGLGALSLILGALFIFGIGVQLLGAIGFATGVVAAYFATKKSVFVTESLSFYVLFALVALSLVLLGPGPFSIDLPL